MEGESERNVQAERRAAADAEFVRLEQQVCVWFECVRYGWVEGWVGVGGDLDGVFWPGWVVWWWWVSVSGWMGGQEQRGQEQEARKRPLR